jgi:phenylacetate-CoA ligase
MRLTLLHAFDHSPFYRRRFTEGKIGRSDLATLEDLRSVPFLEKEDLRIHGEELRTPEADRRNAYRVQTSGTTGTPIAVTFTPDDVQERYAILYRMYGTLGVGTESRTIRFSGRTAFPDADRNRRFWRVNRAGRQMIMSSYHLSARNIADYVRAIESFRPEMIDGYPSAIYALSRLIEESGKPLAWKPKAVVTTAETLEQFQAEAISQTFGGCPVLSQYASSEGAPFITENGAGEHVLNIDTGVFEILDPKSGEPLKGAGVGELVVTSFTTHAYPLIRYKIGDLVEVEEDGRAVNWPMPKVARVLGRQEDIVFTSFRGFVGRLDPVFKKCPTTIVASQIVQQADDDFIIRIVPDKARFTWDDLRGLEEELRQRVGPVSVRIEICNELPRGANGKLRAVVVAKGARRIGVSRAGEYRAQEVSGVRSA